MRILLINQEHALFGGPGGAERSVQSIAEYFASVGHKVTYVAMTRRSLMREMEASGIHSVRNINGVKTILLGKRTPIPTHADLIRPIVIAERPDVIHTNVFHSAPQLWKELQTIGVPIVHTLREYKLMCKQNMFDGERDCGLQCDACSDASSFAIDASNSVDSVVGISDFTLRRHVSTGFFSNAQIKRVIPNSHKASRAFSARSGIDPESPIRIGFLGRMHASKGINLVIDVFSKLPPEKFVLKMAGDLQDAEIANKVTALSQTHNAEYLGFVNPETFFKEIDFLLIPSIWHEPFGRISIEAFGSAVPVIASRRGGLTDIVQDGQNGWLFDPDNPLELEQVLKSLLTITSEQYSKISSNCLTSFKNYAPDKIGDAYLSLYRDTINNKNLIADHSRDVLLKHYEKFSNESEAIKKMQSSKTIRERRPLRILVVTGEFPKLSETFVLNHITGLIDLGVDVRVLYNHEGTGDTLPSDYIKYKLKDRSSSIIPDGVSLEVIRELSREARGIGSKLRPSPIEVDDVTVPAPDPVDEAHSMLMSLDKRLQQAHAAKVFAEAAKDVDLIHCHFGHRPRYIFQFMKHVGVRIPVVCSYHGIDMSAHIVNQGPALYDDVKGLLHKALPISNFFRQRLIGLGFDQQDVSVHHVGVDCRKFKFAVRQRASMEPLRLVSVGRFVEKKGFEYAIRAVAQATLRRPDLKVSYRLIGSGLLLKDLKAIVDELGAHSYIELLGSQPHAVVTDVMAESHAMLAPSVTGLDGDMEGIPTVTMEAMASGLPVLATRHSGIPEAVIDGHTGLLSDERDVEGLANNIVLLYDNPDMGPTLGRNGRLHVMNEFNIEKQNQKLLSVYENIVFSTRYH